MKLIEDVVVKPLKVIAHERGYRFFMGERNPILLRIPPGVAHGMKGLEPSGGMLVNTPSHPYHYVRPDEYRIHPHDHDIPYDWSRKDG